MQHFCTFETAQRLALAGFPQPEKEVGQFWYNINSELCPIVSRDYGFKQLYGIPIHKPKKEIYFIGEMSVFAPGIADLLQALGPIYEVKGDYFNPLLYQIIFNKDAADQLAALWLRINEGNKFGKYRTLTQ